MIREKMALFGCEESYFFRDGTPFNAGENNFLASRFPPGCQVMQGAIRTAILNGHGVDFQAYRRQRCNVCGSSLMDCAVMRAVGKPGDLDSMELDFYGPFLVRRRKGSARYKRIYPAPGDLVRLSKLEATEDENNILPFFGRLRPEDRGWVTDLGRVLLPTMPQGGRSQPLNGAWISEKGLLAYLRGETVDSDEIYFAEPTGNTRLKNSGFLKKEERIGIARNVATRVTEQEMFYAVEHLRFDPKFELCLGERIKGLPDLPMPELIKLGGEGRMTTLQVVESEPLPWEGIADAINRDAKRLFNEYCFKLVFLTPVCFGNAWPLHDFIATKRKDSAGEEVDVWRGELVGVPCTLVSMCVERMEKIGGWDQANRQPKLRRSYFPAGSVLYFTSTYSGEKLVTAFHDHKFGKDTKIGFGQATIGRW
jgi:CRISPR type III-B/RAMP module-associated protein Cmr3